MNLLPIFIVLLHAFTNIHLALCGTKVQRTKVLILGAGVSGITAAKTLNDNGIDDFLVLEAQSYIGGRFKQFDLNGAKLEEGANWVHYTEENGPIWKLSQQYGLKGMMSNFEDVVMRDEKGKDITDKELLHEMEKSLERATELGEQRKKEKRPDVPLGVGLGLVGWEARTPLEKVVEYHNVDFEYAERPGMCSLGEAGTAGEADFFVSDPRGYGHIWRELAKPFQEKIKLNTIVKTIAHGDRGVRVKTKDGMVYLADFVICTFSNSVLKSNLVKFVPPLPPWKMEAIFKVPLAVYTKIFIKFPRKFWDDHEYILYAHRRRGYYPIWADLDRKGVAPGSGILHVTVTSEMGRTVENQPENVTLAEIMKELRKVYGKNIPEAEGIVYSKWSKNPYVQGSFPYVVPGATSDDFYNLKGNIKNRLYFAGDACEPNWMGLAQGAYHSGERSAKEVIDCMTRHVCPHFNPKRTIVKSIYI